MGCLLKEVIYFPFVYVVSLRSSQEKDAKSKFSDFLLTLLLLWHSEIYLCQGNSQYYSYGAENIILVRAEAMHAKLLLLLLLNSIPVPAKAGIKQFRNRQIANLLVHWTVLALISLFTHPPIQVYYKPETSLVIIEYFPHIFWQLYHQSYIAIFPPNCDLGC